MKDYSQNPWDRPITQHDLDVYLLIVCVGLVAALPYSPISDGFAALSTLLALRVIVALAEKWRARKRPKEHAL